MNPDWATIQGLLQRARSGDAEAVTALIERLWPWWTATARASRTASRVEHPEEIAHDVATRLAERFRRDAPAELALYDAWQARNPVLRFSDWLRIVTTNVTRDLVRARIGRWKAGSAPGDTPGGKRLLNEFFVALADDDQVHLPRQTPLQTARQLLEFAASRLAPDQQKLLALWLQGHDPGELGEQIGTGADQARKGLRAALAVLRREFSEEDPG